MFLGTEIVNSKGEKVSYKIIDEPGSLCLMDNDLRILGSVTYKFKKDCLYIKHINNQTLKTDDPCQHVGRLLIDILFTKSLKDKKGRIELNSVEEAAPIYFKMGFRFIKKSMLEICRLIDNYFRCHYNEKLDYESQIKSHPDFLNLKKGAAKYLKKSIGEVSFLEAVKYGLHCKKNEKMENALRELKKGEKLDTAICYKDSLFGEMYLPYRAIELKKYDLYSSSGNGVNSTTTSERSKASFFSIEKIPRPATDLTLSDQRNEENIKQEIDTNFSFSSLFKFN
jgi:hypothetical protein